MVCTRFSPLLYVSLCVWYLLLPGVLLSIPPFQASQKSTIEALTADVRSLKDIVNHHEQQSRATSLRIFNFPGSCDETGLATKVYDRLLKPILAAAKAKGDLATLPQVGNTIEDIYRAGKFAAGANKPPPPIVVKLTSPTIRMALLRNKRVEKGWTMNGGIFLVKKSDKSVVKVKSIYDSIDEILG